ncbi:hypothetical protein Tco_0917969 [Tanacetum coccineum]
MASVSKSVSKTISIPNEEFSDDTSPSVARKFLNEVKSTIVTLQQAAKFVRDFKSLAKEVDESLAKHKSLKYEIGFLLRVVVSEDIMSIMQNHSVVDTSNLQTELDLKKCEECKYDKNSYDKAYNDMQQKIERLQAQLGDVKGKSMDTQCASDTLDPLSQKLEDENVELDFQNDHEDIGKLGAKGDIGFFIGYYANSCAYRVYNLRIKKIMETMSVTFDELSAMAFEQCSSKPALQGMTSGQITMYDDYIGGHPSTATRTAMAAQAPQVLQTLMASTTTANTALTPTNSSPQATDILNTSYDVAELEPEQQHVHQQNDQAQLQTETIASNVLNAMLD